MGNMSLLISEPPLMVLPELAKQIGLNEAIVLQQVHYWLSKSDKVQDGHKWVYNSYEGWHKQFPFWGIATVKRAFTSLEKQGYLISANYNKAGFDKTKWYRINYEKLAETESVIQRSDQNDPTSGSNRSNGADQNDPTKGSNRSNGADQNDPTYTRDYPETTTENNQENTAEKNNDHRDKPDDLREGVLRESFERLWALYPAKRGKKAAFAHYKAWRRKSKQNTEAILAEKLQAYKAYLAAPQNSWRRPQDGSTWFNGGFEDDWSLPPQQQLPLGRNDYLNGLTGRRYDE